MRNHSMVALALGALAFGGCAKNDAPDLGVSDTEGKVNFNVEIPETGDAINSATLTLTCPGFTQSHELDLSERLITASFGGIAPGQCTATLAGTTEGGFPCAGEDTVDIVSNQVAEQTLALTCQAAGASAGGGAIIGVDVQVNQCPGKVKKIYAIPGTLPVSASTTAQLELLDGQTIEGASLTPASSSVGSVTVADATSCADGASNCWNVTCDSAGDVYLDVVTQDGACEDAQQLYVVCEGTVTVPVCGDGEQEGDEACDDGNLVNGDGCSDQCEVEVEVDAGTGEPDSSTGEPDSSTGTENACLDCMTNPSGVFYSVLGTALDTCLGSADCSTMLTCFTESKCANGAGSVAECVCGLNADIDACNQGTAPATGVCVDELRAVVGDVSNADLLLAVTSQQNASGQAYALYNPAATNAQAQCNAPEQCGGAAVAE